MPRERRAQERRLPRIAAVWLALASTALGLLGGCGSGGRGAGLTQARVLAFAREVNLHEADLPGASRIGRAEETVEHERRLSAELAACSGVPTRGNDIRVYSPSLHYGDGFVTSTVMARVGGSQTPGAATREALAQLRASGSARGIACYERIENLSRQGLGGEARLTDLANPLSGVDGSVALRFRQDYTSVRFVPSPANTRERRELVHRQSYIDIVTFDAGPALIQVVALRQRRPFPVAAERRALALLYARTRAHQI